MLNGIFRNPTTIIFGNNSLSFLGNELSRYAKKVLVVYGSTSFIKLGLDKQIANQLNEFGIGYKFLGGVKPNPDSNLVYNGIEICRKESIDFILAVGGGSVIDTVKAIAIGINHNGDFFDFFEKKILPEKVTKFGVILTITGAGSESSDGAVITKNGKKYTCGSPLMYPTFSILNPELTYSVNDFLTSCGNVDAISHILERYFTDEVNVEISSGLCESLIKTLILHSTSVRKNPQNYGIRAELMWAAKLAHDNTIGFGRKHDWATHTIANEIGARTGFQHGAILAVVFPSWMRHVQSKRPQLFARFANNIFNINSDVNADNLGLIGIKSYRTFLDSLNMPKKLSEIGVNSRNDFNSIAEACCKTTLSGTIGNLVRLNKEDIISILENCT
jgi:alcohol dehydrogenase YqhD (iron-dependent ADH family)